MILKLWEKSDQYRHNLKIQVMGCEDLVKKSAEHMDLKKKFLVCKLIVGAIWLLEAMKEEKMCHLGTA